MHRFALLFFIVATGLCSGRGRVHAYNILVLVQHDVAPLGVLPADFYAGPVLGYGDSAFLSDLIAKGPVSWQARINEQGGSYVGTERVLYDMTWLNVARFNATSAELTRATQQAIQTWVAPNGPSFQFVLSFTPDDNANQALAQHCETTQACFVLLCVATDPLFFVDPATGLPLWTHAYAMLPAPQDDADDVFRLLATPPNDAHTMALVAENTPYGAACMAGAIANAAALGMDVTFARTLPPEGLPTLDDAKQLLTDIWAVDGRPDILYLCAQPNQVPVCTNLEQAMYETDMVPKAFINDGPCTVGAEPLLVNGATDLWSFYTAPWDLSLRGASYRTFVKPNETVEAYAATLADDSPQVFGADLTSRFKGMLPGFMPLSALGAAAVTFIQKVIEMTETSTPTAQQILEAAQKVVTPSFIGVLGFDPSGRLLRGSRVGAQIVGANSAAQLVTPLQFGTNCTYPMPTYAQRQSDFSLMDQDPLTKAHLAITIAWLILGRLPLFYFFWRYHRSRRFAQMDSLVLGAILVLGLADSSYMVVWTASATDDTCAARMFLPILPMLMTNAALVGMSEGFSVAITRILANRTFEVVGQLDKRIGGFVGMGLAASVGSIASGVWWTTGSKLVLKLQKPNPQFPSTWYQECDSAGAGGNNVSLGVIVYTLLFGLLAAMLVRLIIRFLDVNRATPVGKSTAALIFRVLAVLIYWPMSSNNSTERHMLMIIRDLLYVAMSLGFDATIFWIHIASIWSDLKRAKNKDERTAILGLSRDERAHYSSHSSEALEWRTQFSFPGGAGGSGVDGQDEMHLPGQVQHARGRTNGGSGASSQDKKEVNFGTVTPDLLDKYYDMSWASAVQAVQQLRNSRGLLLRPNGMNDDVFRRLQNAEETDKFFEDLELSRCGEARRYLCAALLIARVSHEHLAVQLHQNTTPTQVAFVFTTADGELDLSTCAPSKSDKSVTADDSASSTGTRAVMRVLAACMVEPVARFLERMLPWMVRIKARAIVSTAEYQINLNGPKTLQFEQSLKYVTELLKSGELPPETDSPNGTTKILTDKQQRELDARKKQERQLRHARVQEALGVFMHLLVPITSDVCSLLSSNLGQAEPLRNLESVQVRGARARAPRSPLAYAVPTA